LSFFICKPVKKVMGAPHSFPKLILAMIVASIATLSPARADEYPVRPIMLVVGFAAGGPNDTIARILAERMQLSLGQPVIVENVPGAAASIGAGRVAHAPPDGYTLSLGFIGTHVINAAIYKLPYDPLNDFEPVALVATNPQLIVSRKDIQAKDLTELIAWLKAHSDHAAQGTGGVGSPSHVAGALFQQLTGTRFAFVPYRGAAPALQDLVAGHVDLMFDQMANSLPQVRAGTIKAYAVTAKARWAASPDIPTVDEAGLPGFYMSVWHGLWAPKGTPRDVINKLNDAVVTALADPGLRERFAEIGQDVPPRDRQTPEGLAAYQKSEIETWWPIVRSAHISVE
jgi:tripartite-type tricarboxylate transporter receptor subunit TctC